jgi:hypothetical protein
LAGGSLRASTRLTALWRLEMSCRGRGGQQKRGQNKSIVTRQLLSPAVTDDCLNSYCLQVEARHSSGETLRGQVGQRRMVGVTSIGVGRGSGSWRLRARVVVVCGTFCWRLVGHALAVAHVNELLSMIAGQIGMGNPQSLGRVLVGTSALNMHLRERHISNLTPCGHCGSCAIPRPRRTPASMKRRRADKQLASHNSVQRGRTGRPRFWQTKHGMTAYLPL